MKRKSSGGGGANWMDTYGDMVTLLLCFFVLLFSMSTLDKQKMIQIVQAFNPDALQTEDPNQGVYGDNPNPTTGPDETAPQADAVTQDSVDTALAKLYAKMQTYAQEQNKALESQGVTGQGIAVTLGNGYVFISLNDAVFFRGDSYTLLESGKQVLDSVAEMIKPVSGSIDELRVLGHTAQGQDRPNNPTTDRMLSANRASVVLVYLQEKNILDPARMVSMGYGQWRPVAENNSPTNRAKNRRVELIISGIKVDDPESDAIESYYTSRKTDNPTGNAQTPGS